MSAPRPVALLFPGQGAQFPRMVTGLYGREPVFTAAMDEVFEAMRAEGEAVRADWLADRPAVGIDDARRSTPLLFAVDYALGRLVLSWGVRPAAMLGHSVGEIVAATLAGVFELTDIVRLVSIRATQLAAAPPGGMLAVAAGAADLAPYLRGDLVVGVVNSPRQSILAGPDGAIREAVTALRRDGFVCRAVPALSGFHSPVLAGVAAAGRSLFAGVRMHPPTVPVYSAYTTRPLTPAEATSPDFWASHPAAPVLFWDALGALLGSADYLLVEAGPSDGLTTIARGHPAVARGRSAAVAMGTRTDGHSDVDGIRLVAEALTAEGHVLDLDRHPVGPTA